MMESMEDQAVGIEIARVEKRVDFVAVAVGVEC